MHIYFTSCKINLRLNQSLLFVYKKLMALWMIKWLLSLFNVIILLLKCANIRSLKIDVNIAFIIE